MRYPLVQISTRRPSFSLAWRTTCARSRWTKGSPPSRVTASVPYWSRIAKQLNPGGVFAFSHAEPIGGYEGP